MSAARLAPGTPVRIRDDAVTEFKGRAGWVRYSDERDQGYYVRIGIADHLWFGDDEIAAAASSEGTPGETQP